MTLTETTKSNTLSEKHIHLCPDRISSSTCNSLLGLDGPVSESRDPPVSASPGLGLEPVHLPWIFTQVLGINFRSLCLHSKHLIDRAIKPGSSIRTLKTSLPRSSQECLQAHFCGYKTQCYWLNGIVFVGVLRTPFLCFTVVCLLLSSQEDSTVLSRWTQFCLEWTPSSQNSCIFTNRETRRVMKFTFHGEDSFYPCNVISMIHFGLIITGS